MQIQRKRLICIVIMLILMFGFGFLPAPDPITKQGMQMLGVFLGMIFGWIFIEIGTPSVIALFAIGILGISDMTTILAGSIGSQTVVMLIAILFLTAYIDRSGLGKVIVYKMLHLKIVRGRPYMLLFIFELAALLMTTVGSGYATILIMIALVKEINAIAKYETGSKQITVFLMGSVIGAVMGELTLPVKPGPVIYFGVVAEYCEVNGLLYCLAAIPSILLLLILYPIFCKFILRADLSRLEAVGDHFAQQPTPKFDREQKKTLTVTVIFLVALLITALPGSAGWFVTLKGLGVGGLALGVMGFLWLIRVDGKPLMDLKELSSGFNWQVIFMAAAIIFGISALTKDETGIKAFILQYLQGIVEGKGVYFAVILMIIIAAVITNFLNNSVVGALMLAVAVSLIPVFPNLSVGGLTVVIPLAAYSSIAMPSANGVCAMAFAEKDLVKPKSMIALGWCTLAYLIVMLCIEWPYISWVMG